jgi:hypothetical protein
MSKAKVGGAVTKEEQFSILFQQHGIPVRIDEIPDDASNKWKEQIEFYNNIDSNVYVGALQNLSFNAVATRHHNNEFIALYAGAIMQLTLYSYQIFSDPGSFPNIGDVSVENYDPAIIAILQEGDVYRAVNHPYLPNCFIRRNIAERIAECSCLILYFHELAHIRGGHIDLVQNEFAVSEYKEFNINPITSEESLLLRTLELEADTVALVNSLNMWRRLVKHSGVHNVPTLTPTQVWITACELLFLVMSFNHKQFRKKQLPSHPSILTRYLNIRIGKVMQGGDQELRRTLDQQGNSLLPWVAKHNLSSSILSFVQKEPFDPADLEEWIELQNHLKALYPKLESYEQARSERISTLSSQGIGGQTHIQDA